jgi:undecaprenyl-diphosphatase
MDFTVYKAINHFMVRNDWLEDPLHFFAVDAQFLFVAVLAALFLARGRWRSVNARRGAAAAGLSALLALGVAQVIGHLWDRPRPSETHSGVHLFVVPSHDPSFPSDHATAAFALAVAVFMYHRRAGWLMLAMASIVAVARVAVGSHYPTDVIGGAVLGMLAAFFVVLVPGPRRVAHWLADSAGELYDRTASWVLRRTPASDIS